MRTIIYVGLLTIADAIRPEWMKDEFIWFYALLFFIAVVGDIYMTWLKMWKK